MRTSPSATVTIHPLHEGRVLEVHVRGKLTRADYDRLLPELESRLAARARVGFLVFLEDFHGWEAGALWADAKFDLRHRHQFGRIAIVGDAAWERWAVRLSAFLLPWDVRYFERAQANEARAWVAVAE